MRINRYLSACGLGSRRATETLVTQGRVSFNGRPATLGDVVGPDDSVLVDGKPAVVQQNGYYLYYKPAGIVTSMQDERGRDSVGQVIRRMGLPESVVPVGRLDADSEGLLLLTNDGQLANRLTHPRYQHQKQYEVRVTGRPSPQALHCLRQGIMLDDRPTAPAQVDVIGRWQGGTELRFVLREGRNRQIRRMAQAVGLQVRRLKRVAIGPIRADGLQPGGIRPLREDEIRALLQLTQLQ